MLRHVLYCDCCGKEIKNAFDGKEADTTHQIVIASQPQGRNDSARETVYDLCDECRKTVAAIKAELNDKAEGILTEARKRKEEQQG